MLLNYVRHRYYLPNGIFKNEKKRMYPGIALNDPNRQMNIFAVMISKPLGKFQAQIAWRFEINPLLSYGYECISL